MLVLLGGGTMASLASLGSLGSGTGNTVLFDRNLSLVRRVSFSRSKFRDAQKRWHRVSLCKCSFTTTNFLSEQGNAVSLDTDTDKGSRNGDDAAEKIVLTAAPKPVLRPPVPSSTTWDGPNRGSGGGKVGGLEDRKDLIESLGEVLEKAEKLETPTTSESVNKPLPFKTTEPSKPGYKPTPFNSRADSRPQIRRSGNNVPAQKSVWRKGDSVSSVKKVVNISSVKKVVNISPKVDSTTRKEETKLEAEVKVESPPQPTTALKPAVPPLTLQPKLQVRPAAAPLPVLKKPVIVKDVVESAQSSVAGADSSAEMRPRKPILKDVGASAKSPVAEAVSSTEPRVRKPILKDVGASAKSLVTEETDSALNTKERKPILIDKFAVKTSPVDPSIVQTSESPRKHVKGSAAGKFRDTPEKRNGRARGSRRRSFDEDGADEETGPRKGRKWSKASRRAARLQVARDSAPVRAEILEVEEKGMLIEDLAQHLAVNIGEIFGVLLERGIRSEGVQTLDKDLVKMICEEYEVEVLDAEPPRVEEMAKKKEIFDEEDLENLEGRPPVITIMGHVDHGKTTLLDHIRKSRVAASEAGGITQGIGAYKVLVPVDGKSQTCVFLDTPGHEAFGAMRARGARVTDIAIIVVAADDGIRPQTKEAIAHAKAAGVPIVIAINKMDKDGAKPDRVMEELASIGLMSEEWGGDIPMIKISALKGDNVDELLETVMLVAELQELQANPHRNAKGTVIEAGLLKSQGPVATFIVQNGTLKKGDIVVCGEAHGKIRALIDDAGKQVAEAGPSMPVQVIGLNNVPIAGDEFEVVNSIDEAREKAESRAESLRNERILAKAGDGKVTLFSLASAVSANRMSGLDVHQLNIILKVDVQGSIEAVKQALQVLPQDNVTLKFLLEATGDVSISDVDLAVSSKAIIFGFNAKVPGPVKKYAESNGVEIRPYRVIYDLIDDVRNAMEGLLDPVEERITIGSAEVRAVFSSGSGRVAGCMVKDGKVTKDCGIRVLRKGKEIHVGTLNSLRRVKEIVKEVNAGLECGIAMEDYNDWVEGDTIEAFTTVQKKRTLEEASATMASALEGGRVRLQGKET